jgi:wobble nucleotide-excising tRNase
MKITRFNRITNHRVFTDFSWPSDLPEFSRFNLIYGWNGSGKTTLSNLLRHVEKSDPILEGEVEFHIDGKPCTGASLSADSTLPRVRVFNQDFREANVLSTTHELSPICFLGKDSVEKQKRVEELNANKLHEEEKLDAKNIERTTAEKALDDFCIQEAKVIKELLSSSGSNPYNNYDKASFRKLCTKLAQRDPPPEPLAEQEKSQLKQQKDGVPKETITAISLTALDLHRVHATVETLLRRTVTSHVLEDLIADGNVAQWVHEGVGLHSGAKSSVICRFCGSPIPEGRVARLEAHFNDEYNRFLNELDTTHHEITGMLKGLLGLQLPDKARFYDHLAADYQMAVGDVRQYVSESDSYLRQLDAALDDKRNKPFQSVDLASFLSETRFPNSAKAAAANTINDLIDRHNTETRDFQWIIRAARIRLEEGLVTAALEEFNSKTGIIHTIKLQLTSLQSVIRDLGAQILGIEMEIVEHRRPAEELNEELQSYLGRNDLKLDFFGSGYQITRNGVPAANLSEGERTAISFLYFLKSLQAKGFTIGNDIVVIDDPVSSLDANSLFCAFGYMKDRCKDAGQLFILTHNFGFFRQVKNWFNHMHHQKKKDVAQRPARFFMLETEFTHGQRNSVLKQLDPLLHQYESEYHYLFKKVYTEATNPTSTRALEEFYGMPNIARRLLESFMAFRYPAQSGELKEQLDLVAFDSAKKSRILRFLHTYSHDGKVGEPEHDLSILSETPEVMEDLLEMLKAEDSKHFDEMVKLISAIVS